MFIISFSANENALQLLATKKEGKNEGELVNWENE